jgi:excisionase family DNA binding protein
MAPKQCTALTPRSGTQAEAASAAESMIRPSSSPELPSWIRPRLHTVAEAAVVLHLSVRQVRRLIAEGRLAVVRIGRAVRVSPEVLASLVTGRDGRWQ